MPKAPWVLWRFFTDVSLFLSITAGFAALTVERQP